MNRADMIEYLESALRQFVLDPPDSDFNDGFLAALKEAYKVMATSDEIDDALVRAIDKIEA
jgi:hypothetical protein